MNAYTVNVTQHDIDTGVSGDCGNCPAARAIYRDVPDVESCEVDTDKVHIRLVMGNWLSFTTPDALAKFVEAFDAGKKPAPFSFELKSELL